MKIFIAVLLLMMSPTVAGTNKDNSTIRHNGTHWLEFGPAIISSCVAAEINFQGSWDSKNTITITEEPKLSLTKKWITKTVDQIKINSSPVNPVFLSEHRCRGIFLYSNREKTVDGMLLFIPLETYFFASTEAELNKKIEELNSIINTTEKSSVAAPK